MAWKKLGLIFDLTKHNIPWLKSHAMVPTPLVIHDRIRVYFSGRDANGVSRISFVDVQRDDPSRIIYIHDRPILSVGKLGTCDDSGSIATCAVRAGHQVYLYYTAYNRRVTVPYSNSIGLAVSNDEGRSFERMYDGPILDRNCTEPYFVISPWVLCEDGRWHMWYASATGWLLVEGRPESLYHIKYATSEDGVLWHRDNVSCILPLAPEEANARPTVVKEADGYRMWFCYRGSHEFRDGPDSYRIGFAEANTPEEWTRCDAKAGISCGTNEWDSRMQAYPAVIDVDGNRYMFYNGNGFGVQGFGCAIWE